MLYFLFVLSCISLCNGATNCPLMGPTFPKPQYLSKSAVLNAAIQNLTSLFTAIDADNSTGSYNNSYSIQVFSTTSSTPLFEHSHTAQNLTNQNTTGVTKVDADTVFRIGSPTKAFAIYAFLIAAGDVYFNEPVTKYIPELAALAANQSGNALTKVAWGDITIGELASHMAGIANDNTVIGELSLTMKPNESIALGFPPLASAQIPPCGAYPLCNRTQFFETFQHLYPAFASAETPAYSNIAFQVFAYALEGITGKSFESSIEDGILKPLGLSHTFYNAPNESLGVIPGTWKATQWAVQLGDETPAGGMYSSANDLASFGRSIMNSTLLSSAQTNRWLQPATLTSDIRETVGWPWGLRRIQLHPDRPYELITAFNKAGVIGSYSSLISLLPEYDIGFSILVAGDGALSNWEIADIFGNAIVPAMEQTAREEAQSTYGGTYQSSTLNSSIVLATDPNRPGIGISSWISNGTDMLLVANLLSDNYVSKNFSARLYPTDLQVVNADGSKQLSMKAVFEDLSNTLQDSMFLATCGTWIDPTGLVYGAQALDEFIFDLDKDGKVVSISPLALRIVLSKVG
ncbi:beta-lactamase/transpeptidase-like protein [Mollisia scopiformis]|uniref:Beta-lactamase/transpeptidase-like protein n=1 Tax=Mollisia scopiformis TaxID=149040 RepID=A0A194X8W7_MOLSC|nr:beta-lactamase/transpeptidase-like protein [Mollisia scopiformis]KUJ16559.1 beta-lactamase/transpeptidase-like protein [Mollisia scopiformis]